jgi:RND family efflux transporter MFP subunit
LSLSSAALIQECLMADSAELTALRIDRGARPPPSARRGRWWRWPALIVLLVAVGPLVVFLLLPPRVTVASAARSGLGDGDPAWAELSAAGYIVADRQSTVAAKYTTRIARLLVREAAVVAKDQLLAELDHRELDTMVIEGEAEVARSQALIAQAEAANAQAEAQVVQAREASTQATAEVAAGEAAVQTAAARQAEAQVTLEDASRRQRIDALLLKSGSIEANRADDRETEVRLAQARLTAAELAAKEAVARVAVAQARAAGSESGIKAAAAQANATRAAQAAAAAVLQGAQARVQTLRARLDDHFIRAPFAGVVTERIAEEGEIVAPLSVGGTQAKGAIVTVVESASLQAEVDVAESHLARIKPGGRARISVDALPAEVFPGSVQRILPRVDRGKATVKVRVEFRAIDPRFLTDMAVRVKFLPPGAPAGAEESALPDPISVPAAAVVTAAGQTAVWTVTGNRVRRVPVTVGVRRDARIEISAGLDEGAVLVIEGAAALRRDGQRVRVQRPEGGR